jgi:hypothetical protein
MEPNFRGRVVKEDSDSAEFEAKIMIAVFSDVLRELFGVVK